MKKIYCPWCGSEMIPDSNTFYPSLMCSNENCAAVAPFGHSLEEAYKVADRRVSQKPLTLEEAVREKAVWVEFPDRLEEYAKDDGIAAVIFESYCQGDNQCVLVGDDLEDTIHDGLWLDDRDYNDSWRCWATKPTQEEREAAKWEEL